MPTTETGNLSRLVYVPETLFGTTPATPTGQVLRQKGFTQDAERKYIDNTELRTDSMVPAGRGGALRGKGSVDGWLSYGTYDDLLAAALGNFIWSANVIKVKPIVTDTAATLQITAATKTITRPAGSFITDGFIVGDYVNLTGFTNAGNIGMATLATVAALTMTWNAAPTTLVAVDEGANPAGACIVNIRPSFTFERQHLANGLYFPAIGGVINGFEMSGKTNAAVEVKFDYIVKQAANETGTSVFTALTAVNTNPLITAWDGSVKNGGVTMANIVGWNVKASRELDIAEVVASSVLYDIQPRATHVTGSIELYFSDYAMYTAMRAETDLDIVIALGPGGTKSYTMELTACRVKTWKSVPKEGLMTATVEIESYAPTGSNTSCMITRLP